MKRLNANIPEELLERLDAYCQANYTNRTEAIKAWIKELPIEKSMKTKETIK